MAQLGLRISLEKEVFISMGWMLRINAHSGSILNTINGTLLQKTKIRRWFYDIHPPPLLSPSLKKFGIGEFLDGLLERVNFTIYMIHSW